MFNPPPPPIQNSGGVETPPNPPCLAPLTGGVHHLITTNVILQLGSGIILFIIHNSGVRGFNIRTKFLYHLQINVNNVDSWVE